jgi:hypothetical protein
MNGLRNCEIYIYIYIYIMKFYSDIRKNETRWFEGKWIKFEDIMLSDVSQVQKKLHVFSHMQKTDPKDKCIHKNKHDHIHIYR